MKVYCYCCGAADVADSQCDLQLVLGALSRCAFVLFKIAAGDPQALGRACEPRLTHCQNGCDVDARTLAFRGRFDRPNAKRSLQNHGASDSKSWGR